MKVAVVGLGKIGLPLAVQIAGRGCAVAGIDISQTVVDLVADGVPPFPGERDLDARLREVVDRGLLEPTTDATAAVVSCDVVVVVVPLVVDGERQPDFRAIDAATASIAAGLRPGTLVSYETTLPIGTTRGRFTPALAAGSGLVPGVDLLVCHSPERVSSGAVFSDLRRYPKLVGGIDGSSTARAVEFYSEVLEFDERPDLGRANGVWDVGSAEAAELAKLAETTYRDVNIAFSNELAMVSERLGLDIDPIIEACNSQPYSHLHRPGISVGGHCIPVYPHFLLAGAPESRIPDVAREVNEAMPAHLVGRLAGALGGLDGTTVAVLGLAYRQGVKEDAFSGAYAVVDALLSAGARAVVHDPLYSDPELVARGLSPYHLGEPCDAVVLHTAHAEYEALRADEVPGVRAVADGRRLWSPERWSPVTYVGVGLG